MATGRTVEAGPAAAGTAANAVDRVLDILLAFRDSQAPMALSELARRTGIPKSSCHGIVNTLAARGFIVTLGRPRKLYPTLRLADLAADLARHDPFGSRVADAMARLAHDTQCCVVLCKRAADDVLVLRVQASPLAPHLQRARPGDLSRLRDSAPGRLLMATAGGTEIDAAAETGPAAEAAVDGELAEALDLAQRQGYLAGPGLAGVPWMLACAFSLGPDRLALALAGGPPLTRSQEVDLAATLVAACSSLARMPRKSREAAGRAASRTVDVA